MKTGYLARLTASKVFAVLGSFIGVVLALHVSVEFSRLYLGYDYLLGIVPLFNFESEKNVPTLFSTVLLLISASISLLIFLSEPEENKKLRKYWVGLTLIMTFLALDETASIHEMSMSASRSYFQSSGFLYYAWIIPWSAFALAVFLAYLRFLLIIPRKIAFLFCLSGFIFLSGAVGLEAIEGRINEAGGYMNVTYTVLVTVEELLEMVGVSVLIYTLIRYIETTDMRIDVRFGNP